MDWTRRTWRRGPRLWPGPLRSEWGGREGVFVNSAVTALLCVIMPLAIPIGLTIGHHTCVLMCCCYYHYVSLVQWLAHPPQVQQPMRQRQTPNITIFCPHPYLYHEDYILNLSFVVSSMQREARHSLSTGGSASHVSIPRRSPAPLLVPHGQHRWVLHRNTAAAHHSPLWWPDSCAFHQYFHGPQPAVCGGRDDLKCCQVATGKYLFWHSSFLIGLNFFIR